MASKHSFDIASLLEVTPRSSKRRRVHSRHNTLVHPHHSQEVKERIPKGSHISAELPTADVHASRASAPKQLRRALDLSSSEPYALPSSVMELHFLTQLVTVVYSHGDYKLSREGSFCPSKWQKFYA